MSVLSVLHCQRATSVLVLAALFFGCGLHAGTNATEQRFKNTDHHFAITLTSEWTEMSPEVADAFTNPLGTSTNRAASFGYTLELPGDQIAYVLIQVSSNARVPERYVALFRNDILRRKAVLDQLKKEGVLEKNFLDSSFDTNRHLVRISASLEDDFVGRLRFVQGMFFTEKGAVTVACAAPAEAYPALAQTFARAIDTFELDPALAYRPRPGASLASATSGTAHRVKFKLGFIFLIAAVGMAIARYFSNRVMSDEI